MSQIIKTLTSGGPIPPDIPTEFDTDINSPAIPALNILNVIGGDVTTNTDAGIQTDGSSGSNILTVELTNRVRGTVTTTDATPTTLAIFSLGGTPAVYTFDIQIACFNLTDVNGDGYAIFATARTDGVTATRCDNPDKVVNEEVSDAADANFVVSGNNIIIQVTGILGKTHHWKTVATYVKVI